MIYPLPWEKKNDLVPNILYSNLSTKKLSVQHHRSFLSAIDSIRIPTSVQETLKDENWIQAMNEEMSALERNETWEIVERQKDKKEVGCR